MKYFLTIVHDAPSHMHSRGIWLATVCLSVCHKLVFSGNDRMDRGDFTHVYFVIKTVGTEATLGLAHASLYGNSGISKIRVQQCSLWNLIPNSE